MFNTYSDAAPSAASDSRAEHHGQDWNNKFDNVRRRLCKPSGARLHLLDYEELDETAEMLAAVLRGDFAGAAITAEKIIIKQTDREMGI